MARLYLLTDKDGEARNALIWNDGITHIAPPKNDRYSRDGFIYVYRSAALAAIMNPIHAAYQPYILWEAKGEIAKDDPVRPGVKCLTAIRRIPPPQITLAQRIAFGIIAAQETCPDNDWLKWSHAWLLSTDRSLTAALAARAIVHPSQSNASSAFLSATAAFYSSCVYDAIDPAAQAWLAWEFETAKNIIKSASDNLRHAAELAASAAEAAIEENKSEEPIDLCAIADEAMKY